MPKSIFSVGQQKLQELLRAVRAEAGLTQVELSTRLKKPQSFVSKYESGERRLDVIELREICRALKISFVKFAERMDRALKD